MAFFGNCQLPLVGENRGKDIIDKITALQQLTTEKPIFDQLYTILNILDTKARGLLTVDALSIAILGFLARANGIVVRRRLVCWTSS